MEEVGCCSSLNSHSPFFFLLLLKASLQAIKADNNSKKISVARWLQVGGRIVEFANSFLSFSSLFLASGWLGTQEEARLGCLQEGRNPLDL